MIKVCKDCLSDPDGPPPRRPAPYTGPRCATHHRVKAKLDRKRARDARILSSYGMTPEEYDALKAAQGGVCYICQVATGATKALAVEHDHASLLWRGLACGPCNWTLSKLSDDPAQYERIAEALRNPPAVQLFGMRYVPGEAKG
jgi:hypothetical protein